MERAEEAEELLGRALVQAQRLDSENLEARVRIIRCHHYLQHGELRSAVTELERLAPCTDRARVGAMAKAHIRALQCHYLALSDLRVSFAYHRHKFLHTTTEHLHRQTPTAPLLCRWAGENALRAGLHDDAWTEVENGLSLGYAAANPNLRSQFLLYRALLLALRGEPSDARRALHEAEGFFERFGTGPFEAQRAVLTAAVRILCGDTDLAAQWLDKALTTATRLGTRQVLAGAHAYAAYQALEGDERDEACRHCEALLALMREHRFNTWFLFEPETANRVLSFAASRHIQPETVNRLARRLLGICFDRTGQPAPLLRLEMLGRINLSCLGNTISGDHLSRRERTYVTTLAGAEHQQIDRERLIEAIWPGSEHNSANIYVVRNRLKKSLQRDAPGVEAGRYFTMTGSVVRLENSWVDASAYREHVEAGLRYWIRGEHWQAECAFQEADALWRGHYAPTVQENDLIRQYRLELQRLTEQKALSWSTLLSRRGDIEEAESVLERLLRTDPINEAAVRQLFRLRQSTHSISAAEKTLTRYRRQLEAEQFRFEDIERELRSHLGLNTTEESAGTGEDAAAVTE
jgi:DNA-binding SARP family transcriptional activator